MEQLCETIIRETKYESLTDAEKERLITLICHDLAVGSRSSRNQWLEHLLAGQEDLLSGEGTYTLLGRSEKALSFDLAVQYNTMAITVSVSEDFISGTHPGAILFPLLLAEAERNNAPLIELLDAAAIGSKLAIAIIEVFGKALNQNGFRAPAALGAMAGAAALAYMREKSAKAAMTALSMAASSFGGFSFPFFAGSEEWLLQPPMAAQLAASASRNCSSISDAQTDFFTGPHSLSQFFKMEAIALPDNKDLDLTLIGVKKQPVNSFVQPVVEALQKIAGEIDAAEIETVIIEVPEAWSANANLKLAGPLEKPNLGILSLPISSAILLKNKSLSYADFKYANDDDILNLAQKVNINYQAALSGYHVIATIQSKDKKIVAEVQTSEFYPDLQTELTWIAGQYPHEIQWIGRLTQFWEEQD